MMTSPDNAELSRLHQEIRFAKAEQLAIMTASATLLGALLGFGRLLIPLKDFEKWVGSIAAIMVAVGGIVFIWSLYYELQKMTATVESAGRSARPAGFWITLAYSIVLASGAAMVVYAFFTRSAS